MIEKLNASEPMAVEHLISEVYQGMSNIEIAIDIGANHGFHSARLANLKNIQKAIILEANPDLIPSLKGKLEKFEVAILLGLAVSPTHDEHIILRVSKKYHGRGGIKGMHIWEKIDPELEFKDIVVKTITLDKIR